MSLEHRMHRSLTLSLGSLVGGLLIAASSASSEPASIRVSDSALHASEAEQAQQPAAPAANQPDAPAQEGTRRRRRPPTEAPPPAPRLTVQKIAAVPEAVAPTDAQWAQVAGMDVPLVPQTLTSPMLDAATVPSVHVQAVTDGGRIAWRFTWSDAQVSAETETGRFSDAVGVQFPLVPGAPFMMGGPEMPVHSFYWRAHWQRDIDEGFVDVLTLYPNAWSDVYWFSEGWPARVPASFNDERSHLWFPAMRAGNPMSVLDRQSPVEEVKAEGPGSMSHVPGGIAQGTGSWADGKWSVVIHREIVDDAVSRLFAPGNSSEFAMAVWDGEADNVGGRKHHSLWIPFEVQK